MVEHPSDTPGGHSRWNAAIVLSLGAASLAGTAAGVIPVINALAWNAIGRGAGDAPALSAAAVFLLFAFQLLVFAAVLSMRSRCASSKTATCVLAVVFLTLLVAAWVPIRDKNIVYLRRDMSVVTRDHGAAHDVVLTGARALLVWDQRSVPDEGQDLAVVFAMNEAGINQFVELRKDDLDGCMDAVRRKHPPLAYVLLALLPFDPVGLRWLCFSLFVLGLALILCWCFRELGSSSAQSALLLLASAAGVTQELAFRMNLDVFMFALGSVLAFTATPLLRGRSSADPHIKAMIATCALLSAMTLFKFTGLVTALSLAVALLPRWNWRALLVAFVPLCVFGLYHLAITFWGIPFSSTYLGELLHSHVGEQERAFQGGGLAKSLITLVAFILSPLGAACWLGGLAYACWQALAAWRQGKTDTRQTLALLACTNVVVVYVIHPLLRYVAPGMWAVVGTTAGAFETSSRIRFFANGLLSAAAAYGLTKLIVDAYW